MYVQMQCSLPLIVVVSTKTVCMYIDVILIHQVPTPRTFTRKSPVRCYPNKTRELKLGH